MRVNSKWAVFSIAAALGMGAGVLAAGSMLPPPTGAAASVPFASTDGEGGAIPGSTGVNASGLSFGPLVDESNAPDLIEVMATNGTIGYVLFDQFADATRPAASLAEARSALASSEPIALVVYKSDAQTRVGEFLIEVGQGELVGSEQ